MLLKCKKRTNILLLLTLIITINIGLSVPFAKAESKYTEGLKNSADKMGYTDTTKSFGTKTPGEIIALVLQGLLGIIGIILLFLLLYGGFVWMKARGNESETKRAQDIIRNAIIGMILVMAAYVISYLLFQSLYSLN